MTELEAVCMTLDHTVKKVYQAWSDEGTNARLRVTGSLRGTTVPVTRVYDGFVGYQTLIEFLRTLDPVQIIAVWKLEKE